MEQQIIDFINENIFGIWFLIGAALVFWDHLIILAKRDLEIMQATMTKKIRICGEEIRLLL